MCVFRASTQGLEAGQQEKQSPPECSLADYVINVHKQLKMCRQQGLHNCAAAHRWPHDDKSLLLNKPPVIAALDPGRANKFFAAIKSTREGELLNKQFEAGGGFKSAGDCLKPYLNSCRGIHSQGAETR